MVLGDVFEVHFFGVKKLKHFKGKIRVVFELDGNFSSEFSHVFVLDSELFQPDNSHFSGKELNEILWADCYIFEEILLDLE